MKKLAYCAMLCCFAAAFCTPSDAFAGTKKLWSHSHAKPIKKDAIVGAWLFNQDPGTPGEIYGVAEFHADGTYVSHDSGNLTQALPPVAPNGLYFTVATGKWKRVGKCRYRLVDSSVILMRGIDCATGDPVDPANPACPFARIRNVGEFTINSDHQSAIGNFSATLYQVNDLTLTQETVPPFTTPLTRVFQKLR